MFLFTAASEPPTPKPPKAELAFWQTQHCHHGYTRKVARPLIRRAILRGHSVRRYVRCAMSKHSHKRLVLYARKVIRWKRSYAGYWHLEAAKIPAGLYARLVRLRACESGGRYHITGAHDGAFQYLRSTWQHAQALYGAPYRLRTSSANVASKDHQDAVTAFYWTRSPGEWACGA